MDAHTIEPSSKQTLIQELKQTFRSLRHRNFRIYFVGQLVSLCGTWMQNLALSWLVYKMTNDARLLGIVEFANLSPVLVFSLWGGWVADHLDRRRVLLITQVSFMVQATILAYLTLTNQVQVWHIIVLALFSGTIFAFEIPSRQALIVNMVDRKDLVNAISLNSSLFNGARVIGPALAAITIRQVGEGYCFGINAISYLAALCAIALLRVPHQKSLSGKGTARVIEGLKYTFGTAEIRLIIVLTASLTLSQFQVLTPVITKEILHGDIEGFGALKCATALGSVIAALALANRGRPETLKRGIGIAGVCFGLVLLCFAFSRDFYISTLASLILGFCMTFQLSGSHSLLQISVPDELRGRLMSVWTMIIMGLSPVGSLVVCWIAHQVGAPMALVMPAVISFLAAVFYLTQGKSWIKPVATPADSENM